MIIGRIDYDLDAVRYIIEIFTDLFLEFDRDFINKKNTGVVWEAVTLMYFDRVGEMLLYITEMIMYDKISMYDIGISYSNKVLRFHTEKDVAFIGDGTWIRYQSPIFWYDKCRKIEYDYYIGKYIGTMTRKYSDIYLRFYHRKRSNKIMVLFNANGINKKKYYKIARQLLEKVDEL